MLQGRAALVTGSTSGIGLAIAEGLAAKGSQIMMNGFGDIDEIEDMRRTMAILAQI
jgi:3-hydroxybutyrate dehydrogenase